MAVEPTSETFGVFELSGMRLALPIAALREVVPRETIFGVPHVAAGLVGVVHLRGAVVPVVDLRAALGLPTTGEAPEKVVIMSDQGHLLGLLAHDVVGVIASAREAQSRLDATATILRGAFHLPEENTVVSILSPEAIRGLPGVPVGAAIEPTDDDARQDAERTHLMLMRGGDLGFALHSDLVHTTILEPRIEPSALASGSCMGVLESGGQRIPAVDLLALCGLGVVDRGRPTHAFLVPFTAGLVAFVVEEITDVVRADLSNMVPLSAHLRVDARCFSGTLAVDALPEHVRSASATSEYYLVLDRAALHADAELQRLARLNQACDETIDATHAATDVAQVERRQLLIYELGAAGDREHQASTTISQITEILPWDPQNGRPGETVGPRALLMSRGRAIPIYCLATLVGRTPEVATETACVLIIEDGGEAVGYMVPRLVTMEDASCTWLQGPGSATSPFSVGSWGAPALVETSDGRRVLPVLDLEALARTLRAA